MVGSPAIFPALEFPGPAFCLGKKKDSSVQLMCSRTCGWGSIWRKGWEEESGPSCGVWLRVGKGCGHSSIPGEERSMQLEVGDEGPASVSTAQHWPHMGITWDLKTVAWTITGAGFWFHQSDMRPEHQDL